MRTTPKRVRMALAAALVAAAAPWLGATSPAQASEAAITVSPGTDLDPDGDTVTVSGSGFEGVGVYVRLCSEPPGPIGTVEGRPPSAQCDADNQHWVGTTSPPATAVMGLDGTFSVELEVVAAFGAVDCTTEVCGVAIRRDHNGGTSDASYDSFTPIEFASGPTTTEPTTPTTPTTQPTTPTTGAPIVDDRTIVAGSLEWGFRESFRRYLVSPVANGSIEVTSPATQAPGNGPFTFPLAGPGTYASVDDLAASFAGGVAFEGHAGALDLELSDPQVLVEAGAATLVVDTADEDDLPLATLDLDAAATAVSGQTLTIRDIPVTLTAEGADALSSEGGEGGYREGEPMDPATLVLEVDGDLSGVPTTPIDPNADEVTCTPTTAVAPGGAVQACGTGFLPGEQVRVLLHSTPVQIGLTTADASGAVDVRVVIPATAEAGQHRIELRGVSSGRSIFSDPFTVAGSAGRLPATGSDAWAPAGVAAALLAAGGLALVARRRLATATG